MITRLFAGLLIAILALVPARGEIASILYGQGIAPTTLAVGGCTLGTNAFCTTGSAAIGGALRVHHGAVSTTTSTINAIGTGTGSITVADASTWPDAGDFWVDDEVIGFTKTNSTTLAVVARGKYASTAAAHSNGSNIGLVTFIVAANATSAPSMVSVSGAVQGYTNPLFVHPFNNPGGNDSSLVFRSGMLVDTGGSGFLVHGRSGTPLLLGSANTTRWQITTSGHLLSATGVDNNYDIGAVGATRPRTGYFGTSVISPLFTGVLNSTNAFNAGATTATGYFIVQINGTNYKVNACLASGC